MKRQALFVLSAALVLAACDGFKEAMSAHQDVVARAGSQELSVERLAELLGNSRVPLEKEVATRVAKLWVDYQLLGVAAARNDSLNDPKMIDSAMWSAIANQRAKKYYDVVSRSWNAGDAAQHEVRYNQGDLLAARHILIVTPQQGLTQASRDSLRRRAEALRPRVTAANFAQMASQHSMEPGARERGGSLGVFPKGTMVPQFEQALLALRPGEISPVVQTQFGYHIIYRPRFAEVKDEVAAQAGDVVLAQQEQEFLKKLEDSAKIEIKPNAAATAKAVAADVDAHKDDKETVATYTGGSLTAGELARWIEAFPPQANIRVQLQQAPDSLIPHFIRNILRNELVLRAADSAGVKLDSAEIAQVRQQFAGNVQRVWQTLNISPSALADSGKTPAERERVAATRVESYMDRLLSERVPFADVPPPVADALHERFDSKVSQAGLDRAIERAARVRAVADSTRRAGQPPSQVPLPGAAPQGARPPQPQAQPAPSGTAPQPR